jgi:hypothetical protein
MRTHSSKGVFGNNLASQNLQIRLHEPTSSFWVRAPDVRYSSTVFKQDVSPLGCFGPVYVEGNEPISLFWEVGPCHLPPRVNSPPVLADSFPSIPHTASPWSRPWPSAGQETVLHHAVLKI